MNTISIVMYKNPVEEWLWESGFLPWCAFILLGVIVLWTIASFIEGAWHKWRNRK